MRYRLASTAALLASLGAPIANASPPPSPPPAQDADEHRAAAAALFQQGIDALKAGKTADACRKLAESVATLPDSGAMGALAECDTVLGNLADAWALWRDLSESAPTPELRADAANNAAALDRRLARVAIHVRGAAPLNLVVTLNGTPVSAFETTEHRITPGVLVVVAATPEIERWTRSFDAREGATVAVEIDVTASHGALARRERGRTIGLSLVGAGTMALAVGAVYGVIAYRDWRSATASCGGDVDHCKTAGYVTAQSQVATTRHAATIASWSSAIGLGTVAVGALVTLSFRTRTVDNRTAWHASPVVGKHTVGIALTGGCHDGASCRRRAVRGGARRLRGPAGSARPRA